jgi:serine phosphatase RsbU (regulator of sigma subunit)
MTYSNAGHENPWLRRAGGGVVRLTAGGGPPLCVVDDCEYRSARVQLACGDLLCVVSDGVTEANDASGAMYGASRVDEVLAAVASAHDAIERLRAAVQGFSVGTDQSDDISVLALRWTPTREA